MTKNQVRMLVDIYATTNKKEEAMGVLLEIEGDCNFLQDVRENIFKILTENVQEDLQYKLGCALSDGDVDTAWSIITGLYREPTETASLIADGEVVAVIPEREKEGLFKAEFAGEALIRAKTRQQAKFNLQNNLMIENKYIEINMCYEYEEDANE